MAPAADADLAEILSYIAARNELAALRLFNLIESALEHTSEHPYLYKHSERLEGTREIVVHPNYILVYQVEQSSIKVLACAALTSAVSNLAEYSPLAGVFIA